MSDEKTEEIKPTETKTTETSNADFRQTTLFKTMTEKNAELQSQIKAIADADKAAKEATKQKQLEAKGEYETLLTDLNAKIEAQNTQHTQELLQRDLKLVLSNAGLSNPLVITGAMVGYDAESATIEEYVTSLQTSNPELFTTVQKPGAMPIGTPGQRSTTNIDWAAVKADSTGKDINKAKEAIDKIRAYALANGGKMPS